MGAHRYGYPHLCNQSMMVFPVTLLSIPSFCKFKILSLHLHGKCNVHCALSNLSLTPPLNLTPNPNPPLMLGRLAVLVQGLQLCRHLRPLWPHFLSSPHSIFHPSLRLPLEISSSPHPYSAISEGMDDGSGAGEQGSTVYVGGGAMDATQRVSALRRLREV